MLIFGVFVLFPLAVNIAYSTTGGNALFLDQPRTSLALDQYERLFDCGNYLDPADLSRRPVLDCGLEHDPPSSSCRSR
jgi:ABC-type sugar transport system permease subunit